MEQIRKESSKLRNITACAQKKVLALSKELQDKKKASEAQISKLSNLLPSCGDEAAKAKLIKKMQSEQACFTKAQEAIREKFMKVEDELRKQIQSFEKGLQEIIGKVGAQSGLMLMDSSAVLYRPKAIHDFSSQVIAMLEKKPLCDQKNT
jgi:hypothetical protein